MKLNPQEYLAARIIASLIIDWPSGPDLDTPVEALGMWAEPVQAVREPYQLAADLMIKTGKQYDSAGDAAIVWEALRTASTAEKPWAKLDPFIRTAITEAHAMQSDAAPATRNGTKPSTPAEYEVWKPHIISAADLYGKDFPKLVWTVDGLIPEGLCILAGKPKSKKSWLALAVAVGVAYGGKAFGYYDVAGGRVLYLDLESNQRRMKSRLRGIIGDRVAWPKNFDIVTEWKRGDEGIALLDGYCAAHPDTRLMVIDIWARFRAMRDPKADAYEQDYNALQALNAWAESRHVTVIVIHHTRKAKSDDVFEEISGTTGIVGAVATAMILTRSPDVPDEQLLHMTGRDLIVDEPIALKWDNYTCQHIYVATGAEASSSAGRRRILEAMEDDREYQLKDLAAALGKSVKALDNQLRRLMDDNLIQRTGRGLYAKVIISNGNGGNGGNGGEDRDSGLFSDKHSTDRSSVEMGVEMPLGLSNGLNGSFHDFHADSEGTSFWDSIPPDRRTNVRFYLRSNMPKDQEEAERLCRLYDVDYEAARRAVQSEQ